MAERYNPAVRERQREHIRALMQQDRDALFRQMDTSICRSNRLLSVSVDFIRLLILRLKNEPYPSLDLGEYSWRFYLYMRHVQPKLCKEWRFCEKVRDPRNADRVELATQLADFLVEKSIHRARIDAPAAALLMIDPAELCGCEETK